MIEDTIDITWEEHTFRVTYEWSKPRPARTNCSNDDACPAEGGFEGINQVHLVKRGPKGREVLRSLSVQEIEKLTGLYEHVAEEVANRFEADKEADAEERADARREEMMEDKAEGREW